MRSKGRGASISDAEVTHVDEHGLWVLVKEREYFLPHETFPWFRNAKIADVLDVKLRHESHLHWPKLDVDLCVESLENPQEFPLICKK